MFVLHRIFLWWQSCQFQLEDFFYLLHAWKRLFHVIEFVLLYNLTTITLYIKACHSHCLHMIWFPTSFYRCSLIFYLKCFLCRNNHKCIYKFINKNCIKKHFYFSNVSFSFIGLFCTCCYLNVEQGTIALHNKWYPQGCQIVTKTAVNTLYWKFGNSNKFNLYYTGK